MTTTPRTPALRLSGVSKNFGPVRAVGGLDLDDRARARSWPSSAPTAPARRAPSTWCSGLTRPDTGSVEVLGLTPREAIGHGLVSAVMQTGGLLKDLTVAETVRLTASLFARPAASTRCWRGPASPRSATARSASAPAASSSGCGSRWRCCPTPTLLVLDEPTTGMDVEGRRAFWSAIREDAAAGPHGPVRHPLPRGGRRVRRPDRAGQPGPDRGRRHRGRDQGARLGPDGPGHAARRRPRRRSRALPGVDAVEVRGDTVLVHADRLRRGRALPAHRTPTPTTSRSPPQPRGGVPRPHPTHRLGAPTHEHLDRHSTPQRQPTAASARCGGFNPTLLASSCGGCCATGAR